MDLQTTFETYVRPAMAPVVGMFALAFFGWHALSGDTGLLALGGYKAEQARLSVRAEALAERRAALEHKVALLGDRAEPDYAEELVRRRLGLVRDDEIVVRLDE